MLLQSTRPRSCGGAAREKPHWHCCRRRLCCWGRGSAGQRRIIWRLSPGGRSMVSRRGQQGQQGLAFSVACEMTRYCRPSLQTTTHHLPPTAYCPTAALRKPRQAAPCDLCWGAGRRRRRRRRKLPVQQQLRRKSEDEIGAQGEEAGTCYLGGGGGDCSARDGAGGGAAAVGDIMEREGVYRSSSCCCCRRRRL